MKRVLISVIASLLLLTQLVSCSPDSVPPRITPAATQIKEPAPTDATPAGHGTPQPTAEPSIPYNVVVNEVMPDNEYLCMGNAHDWIELFNTADSPATLQGYYLTDNVYNTRAMSLEDIVIPAYGYAVVTLDDAAPFHLSKNGETVYLAYEGRVVSSLEYGQVSGGESICSTGICEFPTPGYANDDNGYVEYINSLTLPELIISEVLSQNSSYNPVKKKYYDIVEIQNISDKTINLSEYTLSDKKTEPLRYVFPDVSLKPGDFYIVYCSGNTSLGKDHAGFNISSGGERIYLYKNDQLTDCIRIPGDLKCNESYGRHGNLPVYLKNVTIGDSNTDGYIRGIATPTVDVLPGLYEAPVTVTLTGPGTIYYTTDGSRPTTASAVYNSPIAIDGITTIRALSKENQRTSIVGSYTYVIGEKHNLPIVSVSIPQEHLTGEEGVLNHIDKKYEYESVITLFENGKVLFSEACGFKLHGNDSRKGAKQNFKLIFRSEYGASKLNYPVFADRDIDEYNSLLLKGGSEDWNRSMMRDELATDIVDGTTNLYTQAIKPVILYLGGEYWGVYYLRERYDETYVATHLNVSEESVDLVYSTGLRAENGSNKDFKALIDYIDENDMSTKENYEYLCSKVDITSLIDWYVCRSYMGDKDCANVRRFRSKEADGKWYWAYFDLDWSFHSKEDGPLTAILKGSGDWRIILAVLQSSQGRDAFLKRYAYLMSTILNPEYIINIIDGNVALIDSEMERDRTRWGKTYAGWQKSVEYLRNYVRDNVRTKYVLNHLQNYFKLSNEQMDYYFGEILSKINF